MAKISSRPVSPGRRLRVGSHIKICRLGYYHHGIYVGRGKVIEYSGKSTKLTKNSPVVCTLLRSLRLNGHRDCRVQGTPSEGRDRRQSQRTGENDYSVFRNNREHFAADCVTGKSESKQVRAFVLGGSSSFKSTTLSSSNGMASDGQISSPGRGPAIVKVATATVIGLATGGVFFGPVGAAVIGGSVCWLSYRQWLKRVKITPTTLRHQATSEELRPSSSGSRRAR